jgi:hypothetical protein
MILLLCGAGSHARYARNAMKTPAKTDKRKCNKKRYNRQTKSCNFYRKNSGTIVLV